MKELPNMFNVTNIGTGQIDLRGTVRVYEFRPLEMFIKEDGAKDDRPSFAFIGKNLQGSKCVMQISSDMFRVAFEEMKKIYGD